MERYIATLVQHARDYKWDPVVVYSVRTNETPARIGQLATYMSEGVRVVIVRDRYEQDANYARRELRAMWTIARLRPRLLHVNHGSPSASMLGAIVAANMQIPYITTTHGGADEYWPTDESRAPVYTYMYQTAGANIAVSDSVADRLAAFTRLPRDRFHTIYHGESPDDFPPLAPEVRTALRQEWGISPDSVVIVSVARLVELKGLDVLLRAVSVLKQRGKPVVAVLAGDGESRNRLVRLARNLNIEDSVRFLGYRRDSARILAAGDIFVFPTLAEGLGLVLLEAMAAGIPAVASRVGGIPEILTHGTDGFLVRPDDILGFADAIQQLRDDHSLRARIGLAAQATVRSRFSRNQMVAETFKLYEDVYQTGRA